MEVKNAFIVLLDISGYTKFIKLHKFSLIHAEQIINELLESIINSSDHPLVLNKLQGDAALFYAVSDDGPAVAQDILRQVTRFFDAFQQREKELVSECSLCACDACAKVDQLRLKAILHHGEVAIKQIQQFEELAGETVILAHRLLKNSIKQDEYILLSDAFYRLSGGLEGQKAERRSENCEGLGKVDVVVYYPAHSPAGGRPASRSFWDKIKMNLKLEGYLLKRLLTGPSRQYRNLEQAQEDNRAIMR